MVMLPFLLLLSAIAFTASGLDEIESKFVKEVNDIRRVFAKEYKVASMHELIWNRDLAMSASNVYRDESKWRNPKWRYSKVPQFQHVARDLKESFGHYTELTKEGATDNVMNRGLVELLVPLQKQIGCTISVRTGYFCLISHQQWFSFWESNDNAIPGSRCLNGYYNRDGLCILIGFPDVFVKEVNILRRKFAKQYSEPSVHELEWSEALAQKIRNGEESEYWRHRPNYIVEAIEDEWAFAWKNGWPLADPSKTHIGCVVGEQPENTHVICMISPLSNASNIQPFHKLGPMPEPKCQEGYYRQDALCVKFGGHSQFLEEVNEMRRFWGPMHQLMWNQELVEKAKTIPWTSSSRLPGSELSWRYTQISKYLGVKDALKLRKAGKLEPTSDFHLDYMELLERSQKFIGCAIRHESHEYFVLCLIGPNGHFRDVNYIDCAAGYRLEDNLCVPIDPSNITLFGSYDTFLEDLTRLRRHYANHFNIRDMHQLTWNPDLVEIATSLDQSRDWPGVMHTFRYFEGPSYNSILGSIHKEFDHHVQDPIKFRTFFVDFDFDNKRKKKSFGPMEFLVPRQTIIGCAVKQNDRDDAKVLCLLGLKSRLDYWSLTVWIKENLAKDCMKGFAPIDGVCTSMSGTVMSHFGTVDQFLKDVNAVRHEYAKLARVPDMHQLTWNENFAIISQSLNMSQQPFKSIEPKAWRYLSVNTYRTAPEEMKQFLLYLLSLTPEQTAGFLTDTDNSTLALELFHPLQTDIGCSLRFYPTGAAVVCLMGPERKMKMFDYRLKAPNKRAGSKCMENYENGDGYCVKRDASKYTTPPATTSSEASESISSESTSSEPTSSEPTSSGFSNASNQIFVAFSLFFSLF